MYDGKSENTDKPILIIPAAGRSSRFPNMKPKWMLTHPSGELMIEKVVGGLDLSRYREIHIVVLKEHCEKYEADIVLKQAFANTPINVAVLPTATSCSPETVYRCVEMLNLQGWIVVKDCDCLVSYTEPPSNRFVVGMTLRSNTQISNLTQKSFIVHDSNKIIQEVVEKRVVSDCVCVGVYGMHTEDFRSSYRRIGTLMNGEMYFSHVVSDVTDSTSNAFLCVEATHYEDWGTKNDWFGSQSRRNTYFIDIDGIMVRNTGKYGTKNWFNTLEPIETNVQVVKHLSDSGHEIVFVTSRTPDALSLFIDFLKYRKIAYKDIVCGCLHSKRIMVNDFADTNPFPSCLAINVPRNSDLLPYIQ